MLKYFRPVIRSRHPSHQLLRRRNPAKVFPLFPFKSVVRFGSLTTIRDTVTNGGKRIEVNTVAAIKNSMNKFLMKTCFREGNVTTADWWYYDAEGNLKGPDRRKNYTTEELPFPIIAKSHFGSRNKGNTKLDDHEAFSRWLHREGRDPSRYIFEQFHNYTREYRLHITQRGVFYACRKMLKRDTPQEAKWYRNDEHCVWILEENELFDKPKNWDKIVKNAVAALNAVGLDIGAVDVKVQSAKTSKGTERKDPKFIIIEINSAPSFGKVTEQKYIEEIPKILNAKYEAL
jgi:glutathione synthase/RimK-type ligase-like ATP-grasp enzyme